MAGPHDVHRARRTEPRLEIRATTSTTETTSYSQPTNVIALTTTFTPPSSCFENILTMLPSPRYEIWNNEPVPVANNTVAACYPSEFLESYSAIATTTGTSIIGSSIVPAMSPFVCPKNHCTMMAEARNYIACCPSGYQFHPPDTTIDTDRPAYGGTCYSDLPYSTNVPVIAYDEDGDTASKAFSTSASGAQAFAHPIDGWALTSPTTVGCPTTTSSDSASSTSESSNNNASASSTLGSSANATGSDSSSSHISTGAIVGATIGACAALALLITLVWLLLSRRRRAAAPAPPEAHEMPDDYGSAKGIYQYNTSVGGYAAQPHSAGAVSPQEKSELDRSQLPDVHAVYEMQGMEAVELPTPVEKTGGDGKVRQFYER